MKRRIISDLLRSSWRYLALVLGGTSAFLIIAPVIGYLPYSDRPGPGWYGLFAGATLEGVLRSFAFVLGWALLAVPYSLFAILPTLASVRLFEWAGFPRHLTATVGALVAGFTTLYFVLALGWYIALDQYTPLLAASLGAFFGARAVPRRGAALPTRRLTVARAAVSVAAISLLISLMFPGALRSALGVRKDSLAIEGTLHRGGEPLSFVRVRDFSHPNGCLGAFAESTTDAAGHFHFHREHLQENFPESGPCKYDVTVCYEAAGEWEKLSFAGHSGPCGGSARVVFRCDLGRATEHKCDTSFGW
jgi:hypothetical protein